MITRDPYGISHAERPWAPADASGRHCSMSVYDTPEQIMRCQSCKWTECINCLAQPTVPKARKAKQDEFLRLYNKGRTDREIAFDLGVTQQTVYYYRRKFGLEPNRSKADPCGGCYNRSLCADKKLACSTKLRWGERGEARR